MNIWLLAEQYSDVERFCVGCGLSSERIVLSATSALSHRQGFALPSLRGVSKRPFSIRVTLYYSETAECPVLTHHVPQWDIRVSGSDVTICHSETAESSVLTSLCSAVESSISGIDVTLHYSETACISSIDVTLYNGETAVSPASPCTTVRRQYCTDVILYHGETAVLYWRHIVPRWDSSVSCTGVVLVLQRNSSISGIGVTLYHCETAVSAVLAWRYTTVRQQYLRYWRHVIPLWDSSICGIGVTLYHCETAVSAVLASRYTTVRQQYLRYWCHIIAASPVLASHCTTVRQQYLRYWRHIIPLWDSSIGGTGVIVSRTGVSLYYSEPAKSPSPGIGVTL